MTVTAEALMVMPRSRSRSIESRSCSLASRSETACGGLEQAVGEGGLAVVDVGDDGEVSDLQVRI
jgi:hypothetical protein